MSEQIENNRWEEALRRINGTKRSNAHILDLSGLGLKEVPESLSQLANLRELNLRSNQLGHIPKFLVQLTNLQILFLDGNEIAYIPEFLGQLTKLDTLVLRHNPITSIPDSLGRLINLDYLDLCALQLTSVPDSLAQLANLRLLALQENHLRVFPQCIMRLAKLDGLNLSNNRITAIPESIAQLAGLQFLYLNNNKINTIPNSFTRLMNLRDLRLDDNPLPEELFAALKSGLPTFFRYLESTAKSKVYPRTVKLVLLGEPRSGKTTLLEALKGNPQPCDDSRLETLGVNVVNIQKVNPRDERQMYLSAWDFAGQHIEHATHQFFLTENAIYVILWNARQGMESGKRDLWYWLELLKMRVREPRFLLVATHTEHTPPDLNLSEIQRNYSGCQGNFPIELSNLNGLPALEKKILELAAESPSLRAEWPPEWLKVRNEIRAIRQKQAYITPAAFQKLIKDLGVTNKELQKDLAGQLHHLGEILYFQDRDELASLVILNPEWVTELIALVVRSKEVREHNGILKKADLDKLWKKAKLTPKVRQHLVRLMERFDLTYWTQHRTDIGIVVEALPYSKPEEVRQIDLPAGKPQTEMIFRFPSLQRHLPPGIPTWGIARAHRYAKGKPWLDAAAFEDQDTGSQALLVASDSKKEVRLRVAADYPPYFFGVMEAILRDTFKRYPGAEPERRLPCSCRPDCPTSYLLETVLKRRQERKEYVSCDDSGEDVSIESLLSGAPRPQTAEGLHALQSEMRRLFTQQLQTTRDQMEKTCPSIFTLLPAREFKQLDTWFESVTQKDELDLALYCEHDSGWHPTAHSVYRFTLDKEWFDLVKKGWNGFAKVTKYVGPLTKTVGKASKMLPIEATGLAIEKLPEVSRSAIGSVSDALGTREQPYFIDIETRYLLKQLIGSLDARRPPTEPKNGGLHRYPINDGRVLWLCPEHVKIYKTRA